ncbi:MAG: Ldh family oxidoreductase [Methylobacteriaceae bacterium]|nr:Ldh family oxidoreductase [Methylobacteriaceae bacterium]
MTAAAAIKAVRIAKSDLAALGRALLKRAGASPENAGIVVDHLLEADAMGLPSHGVMRIPQYLEDIATGSTDPLAAPAIIRGAAGRALADGRRGFGQVVGMAMAREAVRLAAQVGVAFVAGRHMGHTGRIGAYPEAIAKEGCIGIVVCSGPRSGHRVAPFGGRDGRISTNPIAFAYPSDGEPPVVADFSTSVAPEGVIRSLRNRGLPAPEGALRDPQGRLTTDPDVLYQAPPGTLQPLGGAQGYRGTALGLLVDVLAALLAEDEADDPNREGSNLAMLAIAADDGFAGRAARMGRYVRSSRPIDPDRPVMLPGEREQRAVRAAADGPVMVDAPTWAALQAVAAAHGLAVPQPLD